MTFNKKRVTRCAPWGLIGGNSLVKVLMLTVCGVMVFASFSGCFVVSAAPVVSVTPLFTRVWGLEESFSVNLTVTGVINLYACEISLYYDPSMLNGTGVVEGPFLKSQGVTFFTRSLDDNYNATNGRVLVADSVLGDVPGVSGSGVIATVTFQSRQLGVSSLTLGEPKLADPGNSPISSTVSGGSVEVVPVERNVAVTSVNASVRQACVGQVVSLYVGVANLGNKTETVNVTAYANDFAVGSMTVAQLVKGSMTSIMIPWNTTTLGLGDYQISAKIAALLGETDLANNVLVDGTVSVVLRIHDVAARNISVPAEVHEGETVNVQVVVANNGNYTETFRVSLYWGETAVASQMVDVFYSGTVQTLAFSWNTTGLPVGASYSIRAVADVVQNEVNTADNTLVDGFVRILSPIVPVDLSVETDKVSYGVGETVNVYGSLVSNAPVPNFQVALEVRDPKANPVILRSAQTNSSGQYTISFSLSSEAVPDTYTVNATANYQGAFASNATHFELTSTFVLAISVATDKSSYNIGETVKISGNVTVDGLPPQQTGVAMEVDDPEDSPIATRTLQTDQTGRFQLSLVTSDAFKTGIYSIHVSVGYQGATAMNSMTFQLTIVKAQADINGDGKVNIIDLTLAAMAFGSHLGGPRWDPRCDLNGDNVINIIDITLVARAWKP
jgi:5-hydroxyisourate hydrolase-like protein (transthyretin family)